MMKLVTMQRLVSPAGLRGQRLPLVQNTSALDSEWTATGGGDTARLGGGSDESPGADASPLHRHAPITDPHIPRHRPR